MKGRLMMAALLIVVPLLLAGCGGAGAPSTSIHVTMTDFAFSPNTFTVPAGQQISVNATNNGAVNHSFIIMKAGKQVQGHFTDADKANVYWEVPEVPPGESSNGTFTAPTQPGDYQIICGNAGHFEAGMVAKLIVVASK